VSASPPRPRSPSRSLLLYGLLLVGPPAVLAAIGWRSVEREDRVRRDEAIREAKRAADAQALADAQRYEEIRAREESRPYFHYQSRFMPEDVIATNGAAFVDSPLATGADLPTTRPVGWFQWALARGSVSGPDLFHGGPNRGNLRHLADVYGTELVARLKRAAVDPVVRTAKVTPVSLRAVAANEERGQLLEEIPVAQNASSNTTSYLRGFEARTQARGAAGAAPAPAASEPTVGVRATSFRYLALPPGDHGDPLVAWRIVWIPGAEASERRDAPVDRWLLQGYALDVPFGHGTSDELPPAATHVRRWPYVDASNAFDLDADPVLGPAPRASLLDHLAVEIPKPVGDVPLYGGAQDVVAQRFGYVAAPDVAELRDRTRAAHTTYLLTAGGLLGVVCLGFFVLARSVRRELETARRKEDFVAAVSHELKTPLTGIRMYAEMLGEGWVPDGGSPREYAHRIVDETTRLASLVDPNLAFAALDRGVETANPVPGDLGEAVRQAVASCEPASAEAGVPLRVEVEDGLPLVPFDPGFVRPIVTNLVDNAVKYSARSETKDVLVAVRRDGDGVALSVADQGVGIAPDDLPKLFAPFQRGGREETRTARGVGLGLALVKRYADAHRARISLDSRPGRGTTVTVRFRTDPA
jgi:signal transduction histidine kinase